MQRLDLRNNFFNIIANLKSQQIVNTLEVQTVDRQALIILTISSKENYDRSLSDSDIGKILSQMKAYEIYGVVRFGSLITAISTVTHLTNNPSQIAKTVLFGSPLIAEFYSFHKALLNTFDLINQLLIPNKEFFDESGVFNLERLELHGNIFLQIIDDKDISVNRFSNIIDAINKLIEAIYLYLSTTDIKQDNTPAQIKLIDSGSDINIVIGLPKKAAHVLSQLLKEFWDFIANNKSYRLSKNLTALDQSITTLKNLKEARDNGAIDEISAKRIQRDIVDNAERLFSNNTMPKEIVLGSRVVTNRELLIDNNNSYLLNNSEQASENFDSTNDPEENLK